MSRRSPHEPLAPVIAERRPGRQAPAVPLPYDHNASGKVDPDRWLDLPADGPGHLVVGVRGGRITLTPTDRPAALDLVAARAGIGSTYDRLQRRWRFSLDEMLRHGVMEFASISLLATAHGLTLEVSPIAERAMARYRRHVERQTRPIPRVTWSDDHEVPEGTEEVARTFVGRVR